MSKFKAGDEVLVCISQNVTTVLEVFTRTDHRGNITTLYRLDGRPHDVLYLDEDLVKYVKPTPKRVINEAKSAPVNPNITADTSPATPDMVTMAVLHNYVIDDTPEGVNHMNRYNHDDNHHHYSTPSHDTYHHHSSDDGASYGSGSSDSGSSASSSD